ncbi:hypothetical protein A2415_03280 [candidate division WWE3 bacterium RIFOXYC1_FULL_39_7]|uniref:DUF5652 domain-containing protein n=2 Tax=Katanobacteria TaxID=422282 RepID=A0A1F4X3R6_UNCKA|nr:MAG: hypothetical protein A2415_03280 [candidate division WWE3 bacterium RIFOXYC1_FULL_39_7]OGC76354.1 MAG: hypothetical protein A2619_00130 [candidate division WWE3 bacterium RIFOXYD1_FULL_39_9]
MEILKFISQNPLILYPLILFDLVVRGIALWKSAQRNEKWWFIALLVVNSVGILPLIYLVLLRLQVRNKA